MEPNSIVQIPSARLTMTGSYPARLKQEVLKTKQNETMKLIAKNQHGANEAVQTNVGAGVTNDTCMEAATIVVHLFSPFHVTKMRSMEKMNKYSMGSGLQLTHALCFFPY